MGVGGTQVVGLRLWAQAVLLGIGGSMLRMHRAAVRHGQAIHVENVRRGAGVVWGQGPRQGAGPHFSSKLGQLVDWWAVIGH